MERMHSAQTSLGSDNDVKTAQALPTGKTSSGVFSTENSSTSKPNLSLEDHFESHNEATDSRTPPVTPAAWTDVPSPAENRVPPTLQQPLPLPPAPTEAGGSTGTHEGFRRDILVKKGYLKSGEADYVVDHDAGIRKVVVDDVPSLPGGDLLKAFGREESQWASSREAAHTDAGINRECSVISDEEADGAGPSVTQNLAENAFDYGGSRMRIGGAEKGAAARSVDSKEGIPGSMESSTPKKMRDLCPQNSGAGSIPSVGDDAKGHKYITIAGGQTKESGGRHLHDKSETQRIRGACKRVDDIGHGNMCKEVEHTRDDKAARNETRQNNDWKGWLDDFEENDEDKHEPTSRSSAKPLPQVEPPDSRLFPQSGDFERRRSSLYSVHFGKGSLLGTARQELPRSLSPIPSERSARRIRAGAPNAFMRYSSGQKARAHLEVIPSGMVAETDDKEESIVSGVDHTGQAPTAHEETSSSPTSSQPSSSRCHCMEKYTSPLMTVFSSGSSTGTAQSSKEGDLENKNGSSGTLSQFSSMSEGSDESNIGVHDLLEELNGSDAEEGREGSNSSTEEHNAASDVRTGVLDGAGAGKEGGVPNNTAIDLLDTENIAFLVNSQKLRETMLLIEDLHFGKLPLTRQVELLRDLSIVHFVKGEVIFREGEPSDALFFILDTIDSTSDTLLIKGGRRADEINRLLVSETDPGEGKECRVREFVPSGRIFGEEGLTFSSEHKRSSTIRAALDVYCAVIRSSAFPHWWEFRLNLLMKKVTLLSQLAPTNRKAVINSFKYANFQSGEVIVKQGELGDRFFIITRGTATVSARTANDLAVASISTSDDDTETEADTDPRLDAEIVPPCITECYNMCPTRPGEERRRKHASGVASTEERTDGSCAYGKNGAHDPGSPPVTTAKALQDMASEACLGSVSESDRRKSETFADEEDAREVEVSAETVARCDSPGRDKTTNSIRLSRSSTASEDKVLTRLYEGNTFGEMALIYDEPRTATVRAMTEVSCLFLEKDDFQKCLQDKVFHKLMEQATIQRPCYREQRQTKAVEHLEDRSMRLSLGDDMEVPQPAFSARGRRTMERGARSSFRFTAKMTRRQGSSVAEHGRVVNDYRVCNKVGEGSFGAVYKVVNILTSDVYAMKVINKPSKGGLKLEKFEQSLRREVSVMKVLKHPNVVTLWEVINDPRSRKVYMIQEFMERGPLLEEGFSVDPIPEDEAVTKFIQAARGLQYVHSYGICHGDIKPSNILEDHNGRVKIADFGACQPLDNDDNDEDDGGDGESGASSSCSSSKEPRKSSGINLGSRKYLNKREQRVEGTPGFQAPELFEEGHMSRISFASDVWALGVTLYQMVVGHMPFFGSSYRALMSAIKMEELTFPAGCHVEPYLINLLHRMLKKNPASRITLEETMRHEWVTREGVWSPESEDDAKEDAERFGSDGSSAFSVRTSLRSASPRSRRCSSSPSRLPNIDQFEIAPRESRRLSLQSVKFSTPATLDGHNGSLTLGDECDGYQQDKKFIFRGIDKLVDKRRSIFPSGIVCEAQKVVLTRPSPLPENRFGGSRETAPAPESLNSNSGLPHGQDCKVSSSGASHEKPKVSKSSPQVDKKSSPSFSFGNAMEQKRGGTGDRWSQRQPIKPGGGASSGSPGQSIPAQMSEDQVQEKQQLRRHTLSQLRRSSPDASRKMSSPQLLESSRKSWRGSCTDGNTSGALPNTLRDELDDLKALERSQRLVRKPDFLMLKINSTPTSNARLVVSAKTGFSLARPSPDGQAGSRRSSAWHPGRPRPTSLRHSFGGFGNAPGLQQMLPLTPTGGPVNMKCSYNGRVEHASVLHADSARCGGSSTMRTACSSPGKFQSSTARQLSAQQSTDNPRKFGPRDKPLLKGESSDDHSSSLAASLLFPVDTKRPGERPGAEATNTMTNADKAGTLPVAESSGFTRKYGSSCEVLSGDKIPQLQNAGCKSWAKQARNAWDAPSTKLHGERPGAEATNTMTNADKAGTLPVAESSGFTRKYGSSCEVLSGDKIPQLQNAGGKSWAEHARNAWDAPSGTGVRCGGRDATFVPHPTSLLDSSPAFQDPMDCIEEEKPEEVWEPLPVSGIPRAEVSGGGSSNGAEDKESSKLSSCIINNRNRSSMSSIGFESVEVGLIHPGVSCLASDCLPKQASTNDSAEEMPYDSGESDDEDGTIDSDSSSDDGLEEDTSVADITDCLDDIGEAVMERDDKELLPLDHAEVLALIKGGVHRSWSSNSSGGWTKSLAARPTGKSNPPATEEDFGHVQARTWGGQVNVEVGVRFGVSLNQGNLCFMEDTAMCVADAFEASWGTSGSKPAEASLVSVDTAEGAPGTTPGPPQEAASYFAVFDGHGGADVAIHLQDTLHQRVLGDPLFPSNIPEAISNGCKATDLECLKLDNKKRVASSKEECASSHEEPTLKNQMSGQDFSGAVAVIAIVHRPSPTQPTSFAHCLASSRRWVQADASTEALSNAQHDIPTHEEQQQPQQPYYPVFLHVANVGDCRAVLCRAGKAVVLTQDHTPAVESEAARIEASGGFVSRCRVNGILGVSRSFGDIHCKVFPQREGQDLWDGQQVVSQPEVHSLELTQADSFLILACDGVWGVLSNQQAVSFVHRRLLIHRDVQRAAVELIDKALEAPSYDNCSCVVVCLNQTSPRVKN